jgi:hypothetical protein
MPTRERAGLAQPVPDEEPVGRRNSLPVIATVAAVVVAIIGVGSYLASTQPRHSAANEPTTVQTPQLGADPQPPGPLVFSYEPAGKKVTVSWTYAHSLDSDTYTWRLSKAKKTSVAIDPRVTVEADPGGNTCIDVRVNRKDGSYADQGFQTGCSG